MYSKHKRITSQLSLEALLQIRELTEKLAVAENVELAALLPDDEKAA